MCVCQVRVLELVSEDVYVSRMYVYQKDTCQIVWGRQAMDPTPRCSGGSVVVVVTMYPVASTPPRKDETASGRWASSSARSTYV